jgi:hypothetical protein
VIFAPLEGESPMGGEVEVRGVAFNDGAAPIQSVELSLDDGCLWRRAELKAPSSPYAWYPWNARLTLAKGRRRILARAVDALGRTQPLDGAIDWNPAGYGWHGVHAVESTWFKAFARSTKRIVHLWRSSSATFTLIEC